MQDIESCVKKGIEKETCENLEHYRNNISDMQNRVWRLADKFVRDSYEWKSLDKAYNELGFAVDYISQIMGDLDE